MSRLIKEMRETSHSRSIPEVPNNYLSSHLHAGISPSGHSHSGFGGSGYVHSGLGGGSGYVSPGLSGSGHFHSSPVVTGGQHGQIGDNEVFALTSPYYGSTCSGGVPQTKSNATNLSNENLSSSNNPPPPSVPTSGSAAGSPQVGRKIAKTWRNMGDRTKIKTRDILKKWQSLANGHSHHRHRHQTEEQPIAVEEISEISESNESLDSSGRKVSKGSWSVHIWSTWVRRPYEDDDEAQPPEGKIYLSDFQVEKFTYYFTDVFDHNKDRVITIEDIQALNERMRHYAGWSDDNEYYLTMKEIHSDFFECLLEHVGKIEPEYGFEFDVDRIPDRVEMYQWMNMWGNLTHGAKAMADFPIWLQILPKILFKVINRKDNGVISFEELRNFYANFIKLKKELVEPMTDEAYAALTSCGDFPLTERVYFLAFANFLLGKTPHGPGKYIFGGFKGSDLNPFQIDYSCLYEPKED